MIELESLLLEIKKLYPDENDRLEDWDRGYCSGISTIENLICQKIEAKKEIKESKFGKLNSHKLVKIVNYFGTDFIVPKDHYFIAMDSDGWIYSYEYKPKIDEDSWLYHLSSSQCIGHSDIELVENWKESLINYSD
jgi:hypothetical protein